MKEKILYVEPASYFPKKYRDFLFSDDEEYQAEERKKAKTKAKAKTKSAKKTTKK